MSQLFREVSIGDMLLRFSALILGIYYLVNIFVLPFRFAKKTAFPVSMLVYSTVLVLSIVLYLYLAFEYNATLLCGYVSMFTLLNLFWLFHSLETMVSHMRRPNISLEDSEKLAALVASEEEKERAERERENKRQADFNEMNRQRYLRVQLWMQEHKELWMSNDFTRDRLCEETGINRQLMLQCLRSQGHYNVHEYITTYRVEELKKQIIRGQIATIAECEVVGFGSVQTARSCFSRIEGSSLDDFFAEHTRS
jgi:AraC-like DNA-binding protein